MIKENFIQLFADSFRNNWDLPAFTDYGVANSTITYGQLADRIAHLHLLFESCGIKRDDKIAICGRNNGNWASVYIATVTYGAIIVPILQDFHAKDIAHITNHSDSRLLFISDNIFENLEPTDLKSVEAVFSLNTHKCLTRLNNDLKADSVNLDLLSAEFEKRYPKGYTAADIKYAEKDNKEIASINYTSGTTGFSKGVLTSGNALAGNITFGFTTGLLTRGGNVVAFLPLAHAYGCAFDFLTATCAGSHIHFIGRTPSASVLLKAFAEIKPHSIFTVPLIIEKIYKQKILPMISNGPIYWVLKVPFLDEIVLSKIRKELINAFGGEINEVIVGGAALNAEVEAFFTRIKFPFVVGYGMTECAPLISKSPVTEFIQGSVGKILPTMEVKIVPVEGVEEGLGEICVRGENCMDGYYKNPEATAQVIDKEGWLHTGDLGYIDAEKNIFIRGRNKTMLLGPSGQNIYPEEIEAKLNNMPYVAESLVVQKDNKLVALVFPDYPAADAEGLSREQIESKMEENKAYLNKNLANYEQITKIVLRPTEFEKTPKKSIKRFLYTQNL